MTVWGHAESEEAEHWSGAEATREEAIAQGRGTYGADAVFYVRSGTEHDAKEFLPDVDYILEAMGEAASGEVGEAAEEFPDVSAEAKEELEALLEAWAAKHVECRFWTADGEPERIEPEVKSEQVGRGEAAGGGGSSG